MQGNHEEAKKLTENLMNVQKQLNAKFERSVLTLSQSYDEYMKKLAPAPQFLPVRIKVIFPNHQAFNLENVQVEQFDNPASLVEQIEKLCELRGDPVLLSKDLTVRVGGPLAIQGLNQPNTDDNMTLNVEIADMAQPWSTLNLAQGSTVTLGGEIKFKS